MRALIAVGRRPQAVDVALALAPALLFVPLALVRYADDDEGGYLLASALVAEGRVPYRDFLHTQMPLLPYVYGAWTLIHEGWHWARLLSALLAVATGAVLYAALLRRHGRRLAVLGLGLFATSSLAFGWLTTVKTHALALFFLVAAFALVEAGATRAHAWLAAGALLGLATGTRLLFVAAIPAFAWTAFALRTRAGRRPLAGLCAGLALGLVPTLAVALADLDRFAFGNLGYHGARSSGGLVGDLRQKAEMVGNLFGVGTTEGAIGGRSFGPQLLLLVLAAAASVAVLWRLEQRVSLAAMIAALLGVAFLAPTPTYTHYYVAVVPFLAVAAVELVAALGARVAAAGDAGLGRALGIVLATGVGLYVALAVPDLVRYWRVAGAEDARIDRIEAVARLVSQNTEPGDEVLASWPGYLYGTHADPVPGLENDFAPHEAAAFSVAEAHRFRMATAADVERMLREGRTRIAVVKLWHLQPPVPDWDGAARDGGYRLLGQIGDARVYALPDS